MRKSIFVILFFVYMGSTAHAKEFTVSIDIVKDDNNRVIIMNHAEAIEYCATYDARLPSARDLAKLSMSLGSKGIVDACGKLDKKCGEYKSVNVYDGTLDSFYFSNNGYQRPEGEMGNYVFWSSSRSHPFIVDFNGYSGGLDGDLPNSTGDIGEVNIGAVICVSDH